MSMTRRKPYNFCCATFLFCFTERRSAATAGRVRFSMARSKSLPSSRRGSSGKPGAPLAEKLRQIVAGAPANRALPTTRELGKRFGVANTTVFRALRELVDAGEIWQRSEEH